MSPGTRLQAQVDRDVPLKAGRSIKARTVYPLYLNNRLILPAGSQLLGQITRITPASRSVRNAARMRGDFTPLHVAHVDFHTLVLANGRRISLKAPSVSDGVEVVRFQSAMASGARSLPKRLWAQLMDRKNETITSFTSPGKWDRAKQAAYMQLPFHPEVLRSGTQYAVTLSSSLRVPVSSAAESAALGASGIKKRAILNAELLTAVDSKTTAIGAVTEAIVTEPLFDAKGRVEVPQGTILTGKVTQAHPAGKWGRGGTLRFTFQQMRFPEGFQQAVGGTMRSIDSPRQQNLRVDVEGGVAPQRAGAAVPLVMGLLTAGALHEDEQASATTVGASNGFALIGRIVALASGTRYFAVGLGAFATSRSVYQRFIARGKDVAFPKDTRIEIAVDPVNSPILAPDSPLPNPKP